MWIELIEQSPNKIILIKQVDQSQAFFYFHGEGLLGKGMESVEETSLWRWEPWKREGGMGGA